MVNFILTTKPSSRRVKCVITNLIVLLSRHVGPKAALNSDRCRALLLVASPGHPHTHVPLNENSCSGSSQKLHITDRQKTQHVRNMLDQLAVDMYYLLFFIIADSWFIQKKQDKTKRLLKSHYKKHTFFCCKYPQIKKLKFCT